MNRARARLEPRYVLLAGMLVLTLAALLRVGWPTLVEFKFDEARMAALAMDLPQQGRLPLAGLPSSAGFEHSPISVYLYSPAFLFTTSVVPAIVYSGLVNVAAVALCWWLTRRLFLPCATGWVTLVPALLLATSPWAIAMGRKLWQIAFVIPLALVFASVTISALVPDVESSDSRRRGWRLAGAVVVLALLIQVHPSSILLVPALGLWLVLFRRQVRLGPLTLGIGLGLATALPYLAHQARTGWPVLNAVSSFGEPKWDAAALRLAWDAITGGGLQVLSGETYLLAPALNLIGWATVVGLLGLGWRAVRDWRSADSSRRQAAQVNLILASWLLMPILLSLRHRLDLQLHSFALIIPAAFLIIGRVLGAFQGGDEMRGRLSMRVVDAGGMGLVLLAAIQVFSLVLTGRAVAGQRPGGAFGTPLRRYLEITDQAVRKATAMEASEILIVGKGDSIYVDATPAIFDALLRGRFAHRFVDGQSTALFPASSAVVLLTPGAREAADWYRPWPAQQLGDGYELVALDGSWPKEGLTPIAGPRLFENGIEVQGYAWQAQTGIDTQGLWLLWQVLWLSPDDTHFTVRFVDGQGQSMDQEDHAGYPTSYRRKGDRILSWFDLLKEGSSARGQFGAAVGIYLYPQVINLAVVDQVGKAVAETVTLGPPSGEP